MEEGFGGLVDEREWDKGPGGEVLAYGSGCEDGEEAAAVTEGEGGG